MNILYLTKLTGNLWAGPNNSVPAQIRAQSKEDNCFWYNLNTVKRDEWATNGLDCKNINDYPSGRLSDLPAPFNYPDIAIVEETYCWSFQRIIQDLIKQKIPYIVVPRSTLTKQAQNYKKVKKCIGNILWYNRMIRSAVAIHYLTKEEQTESSKRWNSHSFVIPNGITMPGKIQYEPSKNGIKAVYIGRIEIYQKGFDLLIDALYKVKAKAQEKAFHLDVYGPDREGACQIIDKQLIEKGLQELVTIHESVFAEEKEEVLRLSDVFIMTSRFEGLPMGLIEALSYGLPCVATKGTNLIDVIEESNAGWVSENTIDSIANALERMINEQDQFDQKSKNARVLARNYSWTAIAEQSHKVYAQLLRGD